MDQSDTCFLIWLEKLQYEFRKAVVFFFYDLFIIFGIGTTNINLLTFFFYFLLELGSLTTANLTEKVKGLQNLAYQLGLEECK